MHQTKKGNQWYFGMKVHIGADAHTGLAHSIATTAANEPDVSQTHKLLHGDEKQLHGDAGYQGAHKREELKECAAEFLIALRRSTYRKLDEADPVRTLIEKAERAKASIRAKVEHVFHVVKNLFGHRKCGYEAGINRTFGAIINNRELKADAPGATLLDRFLAIWATSPPRRIMGRCGES